MSLRYKKIVVKVGTNVIAKADGMLDGEIMDHISSQISELKSEGVEVIFVSSGAVGAGRSLVTLDKKANSVTRRQVLASTGQIKLMGIYSSLFAQHKNLCAQVLVTKEDFRDRQHYLNMKNCFEALLQNGIVPIVNENDVVSVTELMFTDNDELAGLLASMLNVDALVILTNVDGIFDRHPRESGAKLLHEIHAGEQLENFISPEKSLFGRGGMLTKSRVAGKMAKLGITTHIANGTVKSVLTQLVRGETIGTAFIPAKNTSSIKRWIAYSSGFEKGIVYVNQLAKSALISHEKAHSLLPVGVTKIEGEFEKGDIIGIRDEKNRSIGFGMAQYGSGLALENVGKKNKRPLIHYDYLFLDL